MGLRRTVGALYRKTYGFWNHYSHTESSTKVKPAESKRVSYGLQDDNNNILPETKEAKPASTSPCNVRIGYAQYTFITGLLLTLLLATLTVKRGFRGADLPECRPIYMYPSYAQINGFDTRYTKLAHKYHLYLYREQGKDKEPLENNRVALDGIPVLFIPGNAGSFKQVRSIAAAAANIYFEERGTILNNATSNLDFFAADFNEDFTAFHGRTMLDQAEYVNDAINYILSLYQQTDASKTPHPTSVVIIGHSMGGMVARLLPTLQNHIYGSVNTYITLSTPHAAAPVTFDGDILKIYKRTNDYWRQQYTDSESFFTKNVSLVSITGGIQDSVLPADYAAVTDFLPPANGFSTFTSTIPGVWTPIDHLAIVWCDQLRTILGKLLLESVDIQQAGKTLSLRKRLEIAKRFLLSGFEDYENNSIMGEYQYEINSFKDAASTDLTPNVLLILNKQVVEERAIDRFTKIKLQDSSTAFKLFYMSSMKKCPVYLCRNDAGCIPAEKYSRSIPNGMAGIEVAADSSVKSGIDPFTYLELENKILRHYDYILVETFKLSDCIKKDEKAFAIVNVIEDDGEDYISFDSISPWRLVIRGLFKGKVNLSPKTFFTTLRFPLIWDSTISYKFRIKNKETRKEPSNALFTEFIRQWVKLPFETKWHMNVANGDFIDINMHNIAPFVPNEVNHDKSLFMTLFYPPVSSSNVTVEFEFGINWPLTLKMVFLRYRLGLGTFPMSVAALVLMYQFFHYYQTGDFVTFKEGLDKVFSRRTHMTIIVYILFLLLLTPIINMKAMQKILYALDPIGLNRPFLLDADGIHSNFYYLGIVDNFNSYLAVLFLFMTISLLKLVYFAVDLVGRLGRRCIVWRETSKTTKRLRAISLIVLITLNIFLIPYQICMVVILLTQIITCIKCYCYKGKRAENLRDKRNYNVSLLMLLILVMIINAPICVVYVRNVGIHWAVPFSSHHNVLSVLPMMLLTYQNNDLSKMLRRSKNKTDTTITIAILAYMSAFSLLYGMRNMFWIHHLMNFLSGWLFYIQL